MNGKSKLLLGCSTAFFLGTIAAKYLKQGNKNIRFNAKTSFNLNRDLPFVDPTAYIDPSASVIGEVHISREVYVAPHASIRGDEGLKIFIGAQSSVQDGVVLHGPKNFNFGINMMENSMFENDKPYSIYIGEKTTLAHQSQIHGPSNIGSNVFVGMQCLVIKSAIGDGTVLEPGAKIIEVSIPSNRFVSAGQIVTTQEQANNLPEIKPDYKFFNYNQKMVDVTTELVRGYKEINMTM